MLKDKEAVIFDMDGSLVDSMWVWKEIDIAYLGKFHLTIPEDLQRQIEGMSFTETAVYFKERFSLPCTVEEIASYFSCIMTGCEAKKGKPAPDVYLLTAEQLQVAPEKCLVFEDIVSGILAGKAAGMEVCAVEDAYSAYQREEKKKLADYYIQDFREITL